MRLFSLTVLSCLATSTAFTTVPLQCTTISASQSNILSLRMVSNEFAKTEIDSNDVSTITVSMKLLQYSVTANVSFCSLSLSLLCD